MEHSCLAARPSEAVGAQPSDAGHLVSRLDDAVQLGHAQLDERLIDDLYQEQRAP